MTRLPRSLRAPLVGVALALLPVPAPAQQIAARWEGALLDGSGATAVAVVLTRQADAWRATFSLPAENVRDMPVPEARVRGDSVLLTLRPGLITLAGRVHGDSLAGEFVNDGRRIPVVLGRAGSPLAARLAGRVAAAVADARRPLQLVERGPGVVDGAALDRLVEAAAAAHSDALVVLKDGQLVGAWHSGGERRTIEAMSATKSIVNLAVGRLVTTGRIASLDLPVSTWYPEYTGERKSKVTLRHLLNHTSGMQANPTTEEIYASPDFVRLALDAEIASEPGTRFFYNNKAVNLIAGVVERAAGQKLDDYLRGDLFARLGITDFTWTRDRAGNPHGMSGFQVHAEDLARLGQLVLQRGQWRGERLIDAAFLDESTRPGSTLSPTSGLLWWLIPEWVAYVVDDAQLAAMRAAGVDGAIVAQAATMRGRYADQTALVAAAQRAFGPDWQRVRAEQFTARGASLFRTEAGPVIGWRADGYLGQYVVIYPARGLVAVRMIRGGAGYDARTDGFGDFQALVRALVP